MNIEISFVRLGFRPSRVTVNLFASATPSAAIEAQGPSLERAATGEAISSVPVCCRISFAR